MLNQERHHNANKFKKDPKSILESTASQLQQAQADGIYLFAHQSRHHKQQQQQVKTSGEKFRETKLNNNNSSNNQSSANKDHKLHYQEEFNRMRERLFRLLSKVPIQVETVTNECDSNATASSSTSSSSSQSQNILKKINAEPLIIKYYNERSLSDIIDQHFGCSLIRHNFEHGVPLNAHLFKQNNLDQAQATNHCYCNLFDSNLCQQIQTVQADSDNSVGDTGCAIIYAEESSHRQHQQNVYGSDSVQTVAAAAAEGYNETTTTTTTAGQHSQVDWRPSTVVKCDESSSQIRASNLSWQTPVYCDETTIRETSSTAKKSAAAHNDNNSNQVRSASTGAHKGKSASGLVRARPPAKHSLQISNLPE